MGLELGAKTRFECSGVPRPVRVGFGVQFGFGADDPCSAPEVEHPGEGVDCQVEDTDTQGSSVDMTSGPITDWKTPPGIVEKFDCGPGVPAEDGILENLE